ncbi:hypothetical protein FPZ43_02965 [Mucilaginibacter pallidiroseus]|uniref:Lipoprotein n=1 Tax=Mucilaginibacter pallidiroseus TaxID=2599295 RepID=A0A563UJC8_9SPHI|nr:hypothetical protein [Mucilaginibacter pallidiroseus]TWR31451.1 hypothetical protein FPZ43_02965 [Mucilaginibacter pallidiroseus]
MYKHIVLYSFTGLILMMQACSGKKQQSTADSITKTPVTINGKRDSIINNPQDKYGKVATIPDPCIKCIIQAAQQSSQFKSLNIDAADKDILYVVNWVKASGLPDTIQNKGATNGLRLDIVKKGHRERMIASYIYDNSLALLFISLEAGKSKTEVTIDHLLLKRIRNTCYWGVASSK